MQQQGIGSIMTLVVAGIMLGGLLIYGAQSGHELPFWPAMAVIVVNLLAAAKVVMDVKKARRQRQPPAANDAHRS